MHEVKQTAEFGRTLSNGKDDGECNVVQKEERAIWCGRERQGRRWSGDMGRGAASVQNLDLDRIGH